MKNQCPYIWKDGGGLSVVVRFFSIVALLFLSIAGASAQAIVFEDGFESGTASWTPFPTASSSVIPVASGTSGVSSAEGGFHGAFSGGAFTRFGGYRPVFPAGGFTTSLDLYLDVTAGYTDDTRVEYTSAIANQTGGHLRDFVFSIGFYEDTASKGYGSGPGFIMAASNNASQPPFNPGNLPFAVHASGWYTLEHQFADAGGVLEVTMRLKQGATVLNTWTRTTTDSIATQVGGNRYGWLINGGNTANLFPTLLVDSVKLTSPAPVELPVFNLSNNVLYPTIQGAIDLAAAGQTLRIASGTYNEEVLLNKDITIEGANAGIAAGAVPGVRGPETIIEGGFIVSADGATIDGLTIRGGRSSGSLKVGVAVAASNVTVTNSIIEDVTSPAQSDGLSTQPGNNNLTLSDSTIRNNWRGVYLNPGSGHVFLRNLIDANNGSGVGIGSDGQSNLTFSDNTVSNHTVEGWGASAVGSGVVAEGNTFENNLVSVAHYSGDAIEASFNYWGDAEGPGATVSGNVNTAIYYTDDQLTDVYAPVANVTQETYFLTIQAAVNAAEAGDLIEISPGVYAENVVTTAPLTIKGSGSGTVIAPPAGVAVSLAPGTSESERSVLSDLTVSGAAGSLTGIVAGSFTTLDNVSSVGHSNYGINLNPGQDLVIIDCQFNGNNVGLKLSSSASFIGILISGSEFDDNGQHGWYSDANKNLLPVLDDIEISDTSFSGNGLKGFYTERLTNAVFDGVTVADNANDPAYNFGAGMDINLKWRSDYASITIQDSSFSNNANGSLHGAALTIKARDDSPAYSSPAASLSGVLVLRTTFSDNERHYVGGEPGKSNAGPLSVVIEESTFGTFTSEALVNHTLAVIDASHNYWGLEGPLGAISGNVAAAPYYTDPGKTTLFAPVTNVTSVSFDLTIQGAIDDAADGDVIEVAPGTYVENLLIDRPLTLLGPNAGISPNGGFRGAEAIIVPATISVDGGNLIEVESSDVTIDGFVLDGDNAELTSGFLGTNGADLDAACGIFQFTDNVNNLTVRNNVVQNLSYFGVFIYGGTGAAPATTGNLLSNNLIRDLGTYDAASGIANWGGGALLYNNQYVRVVNNVMENVRIGVQTGNYSRANTGDAAFQVIADNEIEARRIGIFHNLHYNLASPYTISGNTITGLADVNETLVRGMLLGSLSVDSAIEDNDIVMDGVSVPTRGYEIWNVKASSPASISGGTVSGTEIGLFINNFEGYNSNAADGAHASISSVAFSPAAGGTGIRLLDSPNSAHAAVSLALGAGVSVSGGANGLILENENASVGTLSDLSLSGQSGNYIELIANAGDIDATGVSFAGKTGAQMTTGELLAVENKIIHEPDSAALGYITVLPAFDVTEIIIDDDQAAGDFHIPAGSRVIITSTGSLTINGTLNLADGAILQVLDGDLILPDGSVMSGLFTFFNSFGSIDFDGDVSISGSAEGLILVSDVHVADGATITVNGTFTIDGCTVDSPGAFNLVVNAGADFTMARTAFSDGTITVNSGETEIFDNRFTDMDLDVTGLASGARIFHNILSPTADIDDSGVGTVTVVDAWGNVTDAANTENNLPLTLELEPALITGNRTIDANGVAYIQPGDAVSAAFSVSELQSKIVGLELLLGYNTDLLSASSLGLGTNWDDVMPFTEEDDTNVIGRFNAAIGLDFSFPDPSGTDAPQAVGDLGLVAGSTEGITQVFHRVKFVTDTVPGTRLSKGLPATGYLTPFTSNSPEIIIDDTNPLINPAGITIEQSGDDMTQFITLQGTLEISASAFDALAGIDDADAVVTLVGPTTYTAGQVLVTNPGPTVGSDVYTTYGYEYEVTSTTLNGDYDVVFTVTDRSGNLTSTVLGEITINKNQLTTTLELEGLVVAPVTRNVTFVFTDNGNVLETRTESVVFTNGVGTVTFTDVNGETDQISAKTATHLRERMPVVFTDGQASVTYPDELPGGDLNGDNIVNLLDYAVLKFYWLNVVGTVPAAAAAEITGDGSVNMTDYQILQSNFYQQGDPQ